MWYHPIVRIEVFKEWALPTLFVELKDFIKYMENLLL